MENCKNLCAMIPTDLHARVREEQEKMELKLNEYVEIIIKEHFQKGETMENGTRTLAFQVSEELFAQIKKHLKLTCQSQKDFVIGLIEQALAAAGAAPPVEEAGEPTGEAGTENE